MMAGTSEINKNKQKMINLSEDLLEMQKLKTDKLHSINLKLKRGEILGIAGLVGSGRAELGNTLFGLKKILSGKILINNKPVIIRNPRDAIRMALCFFLKIGRNQDCFFL